MLKNQMINAKKITMLFLALLLIISCNFPGHDATLGNGKPQPIMNECLPGFRNPTDFNFPILAEGRSGWDNLNTEILMQAVIVDIYCTDIINREKIEFVSTGSKYSDGSNAAKDFQINILSISEWTDIGKDNNGRNLYRVGFNVFISSNLDALKEYFIHPTWDINYHRDSNHPPVRVGGIVAHYKFNLNAPTNTPPQITDTPSSTNTPSGTEASPTPPSTSNDDSDRDGVPDYRDKCPNQGDQGYGLSLDGCPKPPPGSDSDGDGVPDDLDKCPNQGDQGYGLSLDGCPKPPPGSDSDGDGVPDDLDKCPIQGDNGYGLYSDGCPKPPPDRDGDGVPDDLDTCPDQGDQGYGIKSNGCPNSPPDRDGDGVPDHLDACPDQGDQGYGIKSNGCPNSPPDRDGDGVPDHLDACPDQGDQGYGIKSNGCPYGAKDNIEICFNGQTKTINREKLQDWLNKGATEGACH